MNLYKKLLALAMALVIIWIAIPAQAAVYNHSYNYEVIRKNISPADINLMARLVWLEARGESDSGQQAVVEVVFNRVMSKRFPDNIRRVVYAQNQFTPAKRIAKTVATSKEYKNVYYVLYSSKRILPPDAVYFSRGAQNARVCARIGSHVFCLI